MSAKKIAKTQFSFPMKSISHDNSKAAWFTGVSHVVFADYMKEKQTK